MLNFVYYTRIASPYDERNLQSTENVHHFSNYISNDACFEIMSFLESWFVLRNCIFISKQWFNVAVHHVKLSLSFETPLNDERVEMMLKSQFLRNIQSVAIVEMNNNNGRIVEYYGVILQQIEQLRSLDIHNNYIGDKVAKSISTLKQLTSLDISDNKIGDTGAKSIRELEQLTLLDISDNFICSEGAKSISTLKQLRELYISSNGLGDDGAKSISDLKQLTKLNICKNNIGNEGAKSIISKLEKLTWLDIRFNNIGDEGIKSISDLKQLTWLDVSYNNIGNEGIKTLLGCNLKRIAGCYEQHFLVPALK